MNQIVFKRAVIFFVIAATVTILTTGITYIVNPDLQGVMESIGDRSSDQLRASTGIEKVWAYVVNNGFMVPLQMFVLALIPIQFLYFLNIISTTLLPGVLFGVILQLDLGQGIAIMIASFPHYVVEVFAFCLFAAVLFELNRTIRIKMRNVFGKDRNEVSFVCKISETLKSYVVFVLPIIMIAAFLETYVADLILELFQ